QALECIDSIQVHGDDINQQNAVSDEPKPPAMGPAGILDPVDGAATTFEPLLTTSPEAAKVPVDKIAPLPDVAGLLTGFKSDHTRYTVAARIGGNAETAFPDGPPQPASEKPDEPNKP